MRACSIPTRPAARCAPGHTHPTPTNRSTAVRTVERGTVGEPPCSTAAGGMLSSTRRGLAVLSEQWANAGPSDRFLEGRWCSVSAAGRRRRMAPAPSAVRRPVLTTHRAQLASCEDLGSRCPTNPRSLDRTFLAGARRGTALSTQTASSRSATAFVAQRAPASCPTGSSTNSSSSTGTRRMTGIGDWQLRPTSPLEGTGFAKAARQ